MIIDKERKGILFVLSGPSGAGKGTVLDLVLRRVPGLAVSVSVTTRPPRAHEIDGLNYYFRSEDEFKKLIEEGGFLEHVHNFGNHYGTPKAEVEKHLKSGCDVVLEIETDGAEAIRKSFPHAVLVFITPSEFKTLEKRLATRNTESEESKKLRLQKAEKEFRAAENYDYIVINDELDECVKTVEAVIVAERSKNRKH
jgi:guanylate kinase